MDYVLKTYPDARLYEFTEEDKKAIQKLRDEKYATRAWNFGKSPEYKFKKAIRTKGGLLEMNFDAKDGIIQEAKIYGDFFSERGIEEIEEALKGVEHEETALRNVLNRYPIEKYFKDVTVDDLIKSLF